MYIFKINIILSIFLCCVNAKGFFLGNGYKFLIKEKYANTLSSDKDKASIVTRWIEQPLDHFDSKENRTWKMRYFENFDNFKPGKPIFLYIDGEGEAVPYFLKTGTMYELAEESNGALLQCEHRYYGKSKPFDDFTTENLKYLNSKQALADVEALLTFIKSKPEFNTSKIAVVGGSYSGNLAAWMKLLYPNLIDAAISSSAPVLAKKDFYEYLENVSDDYEQYGTPGCINEISSIFARYVKMFKTTSGIEQLKIEENVCNKTDMSKPENQQLFILDKTSEFMYRSQYGSPNYIKQHCERIANTSRVFSFKKFDDLNLWNEKSECFDYEFDEMIKDMKYYDWAIPWTYQTCTEFGYFPTTNSNEQPFSKSVEVDFFEKMCVKAFGPDFNEKRIDEGVKTTNELYGGLKPNLKNVVFVNGDMDPYHMLGILEDVSYEAPAKVIQQSSHCRDLFSEREGDMEELTEARKYIKYLIKKWLGLGDFKA